MDKIIQYQEIRAWKYPEEESYLGLCFAFSSKPRERFILVRDNYVPGMWNIHFCCSSSQALSEDEKESLVNEIVEYIKPGEYLGTCGCSTRGGEHGFKRFSYQTSKFEDTSCVRVLHDKYENYPTYFPILRRI